MSNILSQQQKNLTQGLVLKDGVLMNCSPGENWKKRRSTLGRGSDAATELSGGSEGRLEDATVCVQEVASGYLYWQLV